MSDRLRELWDFADLDGSEGRLRAQLAAEATDEGRAEVLTQLARVEGLRGDFEAGERLVVEAEELAGAQGAAAVRVDLERGRIRRSSGDREAALPLFESAFAKAVDAVDWFLAADAAHMAALAAPDPDGFVAWTQQGIELGDEHEAAAYWAGPLLNNLGWHHYEAGEHELALDAFERALAARERDPANPGAIEVARYAVGKALRSARSLRRGDPAARARSRVGRERRRAGRLVPRGARRGVRRGRALRRRPRSGRARASAAPRRRSFARGRRGTQRSPPVPRRLGGRLGG